MREELRRKSNTKDEKRNWEKDCKMSKCDHKPIISVGLTEVQQLGQSM